MPSLQDALTSAGLVHTQTTELVGVRTDRPAHTAPPEARASVTMGRVQPTYRYGPGLRTQKVDCGINLTPAVRIQKPDDSAQRIKALRDAAMRADLEAELARMGTAVLTEAMGNVHARVCSTCHTQIPAAFKACPDC